jgi:CheY-like chemotaxis protein
MEWQRHTVLVIDGEPEMRETLRLVLTDEGYAVQTAADMAAGLRALYASRESMTVLLDVVPLRYLSRAQNGLGLLDAVGQDDALLGRHAYVVMSTAPEHVVALAGPLPPHLTVPVVRKPFNLDDLLTTIGQAGHATIEQRVYSIAG